jgi:hypothetical protein
MAPVGHFSAGKNCRVQVGATNCTFESFDADYTSEKIDTTNFEATGTHPSGSGTATFAQGTFGVLACAWKCGGKWDSLQNRIDSPPGFYPRDDLSSVKVWVDLSRNYFWNFPQSLVLSSRTGGRVRQEVSFEASCENNGPFSNPTGSS